MLRVLTRHFLFLSFFMLRLPGTNTCLYISVAKNTGKQEAQNAKGSERASYIIIKNGRTSIVQPTTTFPWWSQACKQQHTGPKLWASGSQHTLLATTSDEWKQNYQNGFNRSRKDSQGSSSSTDVSPADMTTPLTAILPSAHPPAKPSSNKAGGERNLFTHFHKDTICEECRRTKVPKGAM